MPTTTTRTVPLHIRGTAASRIGITLAEYDQHRRAGEKWYGGCRTWHDTTAFTVDRSRGDGLMPRCRAFNNIRVRRTA